MDIANQTISARRLSESTWELTVRYDCTFTSQEVNPPFDFRFLDAVRIWEWDTSDHDVVTGWVRVEEFNPGATTINRTKVVRVSDDALDTELGGEEIRAQIHLRNTTISGIPVERFTPIIPLSPG